MGQPSLAFLASSSKVDFSMPGMVAWVLRWILVMVGPSSVVSMVTVAVVSMVLGGCSAEVSCELRAMVKQPAWAAAMSSSGLVPAAVFEAGVEAVGSVVEDVALGGEGAGTLFQVAMPNCRCAAFHRESP